MNFVNTLLSVIRLRASAMPAARLAAIYPQALEIATCAAPAIYYENTPRKIEARRTAWLVLLTARRARSEARSRRTLCILPTEGGAA
jgi:hypothetical protein